MPRKITQAPRSRTARSRAEPPSPQDRFVDRVPALVFALDERGRLAAWNRACCAASGYSLADLTPDPWRKLFPDAASRRKFLDELARHRRRALREWEWEITTRSGQRRVWRWTTGDERSSPLPWRKWATGTDVTLEHEQRRDLRRLERRLLNVERTGGLGIWEWDIATNDVHWSAATERMFGLAPGSFDGTYAAFLSFIHPDDRALYQRHSAATMSAGVPPFELEFRIVRADRKVRWIHCKGMAERDAAGRPTKVVGINSDSTDRKLAESRLHEQTENLNVILQSPDIVLFHQDRALRYTWVANPALGATRGSALGRTDDEILGKAAARLLTRTKRRVIRLGRGERQEIQLTHGSMTGWFDLILEPKRHPSGRIVGVVGAAVDITARKQAVEQLALAHRSGQELAAHLRDTVEQERAAISRDVHDQVGAILTAVRLRLASLAGRTPSENIVDRAEILSIQALTESAMHATRDICSRLRPPALEDVGLADTCRWYLADWSRNSRIRAGGRFPRASFRCDPVVSTDLFRILQELLTNVAKHSGASRVDVALNCGRRQLRLRVQDDGHGFCPNEVMRGFGLPGVRERAQHHGGRVDVATGPDGTTIDVVIPLETAR